MDTCINNIIPFERLIEILYFVFHDKLQIRWIETCQYWRNIFYNNILLSFLTTNEVLNIGYQAIISNNNLLLGKILKLGFVSLCGESINGVFSDACTVYNFKACNVIFKEISVKRTSGAVLELIKNTLTCIVSNSKILTRFYNKPDDATKVVSFLLNSLVVGWGIKDTQEICRRLDEIFIAEFKNKRTRKERKTICYTLLSGDLYYLLDSDSEWRLQLISKSFLYQDEWVLYLLFSQQETLTNEFTRHMFEDKQSRGFLFKTLYFLAKMKIEATTEKGFVHNILVKSFIKQDQHLLKGIMKYGLDLHVDLQWKDYLQKFKISGPEIREVFTEMCIYGKMESLLFPITCISDDFLDDCMKLMERTKLDPSMDDNRPLKIALEYKSYRIICLLLKHKRFNPNIGALDNQIQSFIMDAKISLYGSVVFYDSSIGRNQKKKRGLEYQNETLDIIRNLIEKTIPTIFK